jgi:transposase InsO family protein
MSSDRKSDALVPTDHGEAVALFRAEIIGALCRRDLDHGELAGELRALAQERYRPPDADATRRYAMPTLERWLYAYKQGGLSALRPKARSDAGRAQSLTDEQRALIGDIRREHPHASVPLILRTLIADGRLAKGAVSASTIRRFFTEQGLDRVSLREGKTTTTRLRWQADCPGALWHGDVCHGASLQISGVDKPLRIHALLDDASRFIIAIEAHHTEREIDMLGLFVRALRRHGAPDAIYLDNGSTYRGSTLRLGCERLGITLLHARPYDAPARGKMERFWRTLREGCLDFLGAMSSLNDVQKALRAFVETHYHKAPHASLMGRAPGIVFGEGMSDRICDLTEERLKSALTVYEKRRVRNDTTISIDGTDWELDQGFLAGHIVKVGRNLVSPDLPPWVEYEGKRLALRPVDPTKNAHRKRPPKRALPDKPTRSVSFDPVGALQKNPDCAYPTDPLDKEIF